MSSNCPHGSLTSTKDSVPHPFYEALRATGPVHWDEEMKGWLAISHDICKYVLSHEELFRHPYADADATMIEVKGGPRNITVLQGEEHDRMHRYLMKLFNPEAIRAYTDRHIVPVTAMLLGRLEGQGRAELFSAFCKPLPGRTFMSLFGMDPPSDDFMSHVLELHDTIMHWAGGRHYLGPDATDAALAASHELNGILLPYIRKSRDNPGDNLLGRLWSEAPALFGAIDEADMLAICRELYLAGSDTTVLAMANAIYLLLTDRALYERIRDDMDGKLLDNFIEEVMRTHGSVEYRYPIANQDIELGGQPIRKDQIVFTINAAANRDPAHYSCPARVDLDRPRPRDHIAFNTGPRICVGAALARAEMKVGLRALLDQLPNLRLDTRAEQPRFKGFFTRAWQPLHVLFG